jgi:hypothetical protein
MDYGFLCLRVACAKNFTTETLSSLRYLPGAKRHPFFSVSSVPQWFFALRATPPLCVFAALRFKLIKHNTGTG